MTWSDALKAVIPILVAALAWLLGEVASFSERLTRIEGSMPALVTKEGVPTDSPISAERRQNLKDELMVHVHDLKVKVQLLEERERLYRK